MKIDSTPMSPAFRSGFHALVFAIFICLVLLAPFALKNKLTLEQVYASANENSGYLPFLYKHVYQQTEPIDIALIGSSTLSNGVDAAYIGEQLSKDTGSPKNVIHLGYRYPGPEMQYFILRDLLPRRKIKLVVLQPPAYFQNLNWPNVFLHSWLTLDWWEPFKTLPLPLKISTYAEVVIGMPHHILSLFRPDIMTPNPLLEKHLGSNPAPLGWYNEDYVAHSYEPPKIPPQEWSYDLHPENFKLSETGAEQYQTHFMKLSMDLLERYKVPTIFLSIPAEEERDANQSTMLMDWEKAYPSHPPMFGIPPKKLFSTLSEDDIFALYFDRLHFNANGTNFFSKAVYPVLRDEYKKVTSTTR